MNVSNICYLGRERDCLVISCYLNSGIFPFKYINKYIGDVMLCSTVQYTIDTVTKMLCIIVNNFNSQYVYSFKYSSSSVGIICCI